MITCTNVLCAIPRGVCGERLKVGGVVGDAHKSRNKVAAPLVNLRLAVLSKGNRPVILITIQAALPPLDFTVVVLTAIRTIIVTECSWRF